MILGNFEVNEKDIEEYFKPYKDYQDDLDNKLKNNDINFNKLIGDIFINKYIYDYRLAFSVKYNYNLTEVDAEDVVEGMDAFWMYLNQLKEKLKYDYPLFYEDEVYESKLFFKINNNYYVAYTDDYNEYIIKLEEYIKDNKVKVKYYLDVDIKTVNKFISK